MMEEFILNAHRVMVATWNKDGDTISKLLDECRTSQVFLYNQKSALECAVGNAYLGARDYYRPPFRDLQLGTGFADFVFLPKYNHPALLIKVGWDRSVDEVIDHVNNYRYIDSLKKYATDILLVVVTYNRKLKKHECKIVKY